MRIDSRSWWLSVFIVACGSGPPTDSGDAAVDTDGAADVDASRVFVCIPGPEPTGWSAPTNLAAIGSAPFIPGVGALAVDVNEAGVAVAAFLAGTSVYVSEQHAGCWSEPTLVAEECLTGGERPIRVAIAESGAVMVAFTRRVSVDAYVEEDTVWASHRSSVTTPFSAPVALSERRDPGGPTVRSHLFDLAASGEAFAVAWQVWEGVEEGPNAVVFADGAFGAKHYLAGAAPNPPRGNTTRVIGDGVGGFVFVWTQPVGYLFGSQEEAQNTLFARRFSGGSYASLETISPFVPGDWSVESLHQLRRTAAGAFDVVYGHAGREERRTFNPVGGTWSSPSVLIADRSVAGGPQGAKLLPSGEAIAYGQPSGTYADETIVFRWSVGSSSWVPSATFLLGPDSSFHEIAFLPAAADGVELAWVQRRLVRSRVHTDLTLEPIVELVPSTDGIAFEYDSNLAGKSVVAVIRYSFSSTATTSRPVVLTHRP